uniref:Uncharacterized protein n=1 Tax=Guillardia theta TaxID=55529 RepID=A0A7S4NM57_GUITH
MLSMAMITRAEDGQCWLLLSCLNAFVIRDIQRAIYLTDYVTSWICGHIKRKETWTKCSRACTTEICSLAEFLAVVSLSKILRGHAKYLDRDFFPNVEESMAQKQGGVSATEYQQCQLLLLQLGAEHEAMFSNLLSGRATCMMHSRKAILDFQGPHFDPNKYTALDWDELPMIYFECFFDMIDVARYAAKLIKTGQKQNEVFKMCTRVRALEPILLIMAPECEGHLWGDLAYVCMHFGRDRDTIYCCSRAEEIFSDLTDLAFMTYMRSMREYDMELFQDFMQTTSRFLNYWDHLRKSNQIDEELKKKFYKVADFRFQVIKVIHPKQPDVWIKELESRLDEIDQEDPLCMQAFNLRETHACALISVEKYTKALKSFYIMLTHAVRVQGMHLDVGEDDMFDPSEPTTVYKMLETIGDCYLKENFYSEAAIAIEVCMLLISGAVPMKKLRERAENMRFFLDSRPPLGRKYNWNFNDEYIMKIFLELTTQHQSALTIEGYVSNHKNGYMHMESDILSNRAQALFRMCRIDDARESLRLSFHLSSQIIANGSPEQWVAGDWAITNRLVALGTIADIYLAVGDVHQAKAIYQGCIPLSNLSEYYISLPVEERETCIKEHVLPKDPFLGKFPEDRNAYEEITETFLKAYRDRYLGSNSELQVSKVAFNASGLALITCLGDVELRLENWGKAYSYGEIALAADSHKRSACKGAYLCGYSSMMQGDYLKAFEFFKSCLTYCKNFDFVGSKSYLVVALGQLVSLYPVKLSELLEFVDELNKGDCWLCYRHLCEEPDLNDRMIVAAGFIKMGNFIAEFLAGDAHCRAFAELQLGLLQCSTKFHECKRIAAAGSKEASGDCEKCAIGLGLMHTAVKTAVLAGDRICELNACESLARFYLEEGDNDNAHKHLARCSQLVEAIDHKEARERINRLLASAQ